MERPCDSREGRGTLSLSRPFRRFAFSFVGRLLLSLPDWYTLSQSRSIDLSD